MKIPPALKRSKLYSVANSAAERIRYPFALLRYAAARAADRPYFGVVMAARQGHPIRHHYMQRLVEERCRRLPAGAPLRILEIGSWAGGSAVTWAEALRDHCRGGGRVVCVDPWRPFFEKERVGSTSYRRMNRALGRGTILRLFLHNIRASGFEDVVLPFRGPSDTVLPLLAPGSFDIIYVDGSHFYSQVMRDLALSIPLLAPGGVICGDDLELQGGQVDAGHARDHAEHDYTLDPATGEWYHPGVTLAVAATFGAVSCYEGFWATARGDRGGWDQVELPRVERSQARIPRHLGK